MISCGFTRPRRLDPLSALRLGGLAVSGLAALVLPLTSGLRLESANLVDFPDPDSSGECCRMCGLANAYLVNGEDGHGATIENMRDLFAHVNDGTSFEEAFDKTLGISVS